MIAEIPRSRRLFQVMRPTGGYGFFFLCGATGELLVLQVASPRPCGYMDAFTASSGQGVAYLGYEIVRRAPHQHLQEYTRMCEKKLCLFVR